MLRGQPIIVSPAGAEKNRLAAAGAGSAEIGFGRGGFGGAPAEAGKQLYLGVRVGIRALA